MYSHENTYNYSIRNIFPSIHTHVSANDVLTPSPVGAISESQPLFETEFFLQNSVS